MPLGPSGTNVGSAVYNGRPISRKWMLVPALPDGRISCGVKNRQNHGLIRACGQLRR